MYNHNPAIVWIADDAFVCRISLFTQTDSSTVLISSISVNYTPSTSTTQPVGQSIIHG